ncbi:MAG: DUF922 domain-containing protein [Bacteroidia bacterium]|nr:DUF922 domain-containing protein [Bacteroidia bacterium]
MIRMKCSVLSAITALAGILFLSFQVPDPNQINYDPARPLMWEDFTMPPDAAGKHAAYSHCGMSMDMSSPDNKSMVFTVVSYFRKEKSWVKAGSKTNAALLKHEQGHFDIYELHAREFRKKLAGLRMKITDLAKALPEMYNKAIADCKTEQEKYDRETNHSLNKESQKSWDAKLASRLKKSELWKEKKVTVIPVP